MSNKFLQIFFSSLLLAGLLSGLAQPVLSMPEAPSALPTATIEVDQAVMEEMASEGSTDYWIDFTPQPDLSAAESLDWSERGWYVYNTLKDAAKTAQQSTESYLKSAGVSYQSFWINNSIYVKSSNAAQLSRVMSLPAVERIRSPETFVLYEPDTSKAISDNGLALLDNGIQSIESSLTHINADDAWNLGIDGSGMVVANIDTGVRYSHLALVSHYRGTNGDGTFSHDYNWLDPYGEYVVPTDTHGHGTHTMGTMVGDDGALNRIGIAPGAQWMACRACNSSDCSDAALLTCAEFVTAPTRVDGSDANPDLRPNVVNNSWGDCGRTYDNWFQVVVDAWQAAGIYPVFSTGNASNCNYSRPPGLGTVGNPARYGNVTGVGSSGNQDGSYATHSNWGPTDNPDTVNPSPGFELLKPQVIAPGVNIRSSVPYSDTSYASGWTGTSMSAPLVSGLVALIWQASPCLIGNYAATETLIEETATAISYDDGSSLTPSNYPNFATGWGEIDALAAVNLASMNCNPGTLSGTVTSSGGSLLEGASVRADNGIDLIRSTISAADGTYSLELPAGTYTLTAAKYGYVPASHTGVLIVENEPMVKDLLLTPLDMTLVSGYVTDAGVNSLKKHGYPLYAAIRVTSSGFNQTIYTDPFSGYYEIALAEGSLHTFSTRALADGYDPQVETLTPAGTSLGHDVELLIDEESCSVPGYERTVWLNEGFDGQVLPPGWVNYDYAGNGQTWSFDDPKQRGNLTPNGEGSFAIIDSDYYGSGSSQNSGLRMAVMDVSAFDTLRLEFDTYYDYFTADTAKVRVSADNGSTWTDKWTKHADFAGHVSLDLSGEAAGNSQVIIEFKFQGNWAWFWEVDNVVVTVGGCEPLPGGVVAGYVFDSASNIGITGADVFSAELSTQTFSVAQDADHGGLYWAFLPTVLDPEEVIFTAYSLGYASDTETVQINRHAINRQDFYLTELDNWIFLPLIRK